MRYTKTMPLYLLPILQVLGIQLLCGNNGLNITMYGAWLIVQVTITAIILRADLWILLRKNFVGGFEVLQIDMGMNISYLLGIYLGWILEVLGYDWSKLRRPTEFLESFVNSLPKILLTILTISFPQIMTFRLYRIFTKL